MDVPKAAICVVNSTIAGSSAAAAAVSSVLIVSNYILYAFVVSISLSRYWLELAIHTTCGGGDKRAGAGEKKGVVSCLQ